MHCDQPCAGCSLVAQLMYDIRAFLAGGQISPAKKMRLDLARNTWLIILTIVWLSWDCCPHLAAQSWNSRTERDGELTVRARRALAEDVELARFNLGVIVEQNVAVLWGPVPSQAILRRAIERLKALQGISDVRLDCFLDTDMPYRSDCQPEPAQNGPAPTPQPRSIKSGIPPVRPNTRTQVVPSGRAIVDQRGAVARPTSRQATASGQLPLDEVMVFGKPTGLSPTPPDPAVKSPIRLLPPQSACEASDLAESVRQLCQSDARFRWIQPRIRQRAVYLRGVALSWDHVLELVAIIRRMPGVQSVTFENIRISDAFARER